MTLFLILGIIAALSLIWLIFRAATCALPVYAGIAVGQHLVDVGHGFGAAILAGFGSGIALLLLGRLLIALLTAAPLRLLVIAVFVVPAAYAGYQVGIALGGPLLGQRTLLKSAALFSGLVAALSAWRSVAFPVGDDLGVASQRPRVPAAPPESIE
ncbi:MAG: hypothetical protein ACO1NN_07455 [Sphingopyxis sp.]